MFLSEIQLFRKGLLTFCILLTLIRIQAQCNPPGELPTQDCFQAPLTCLADACYTTLNQPYVCCTGWCGNNTIINNPQYFEFIATATSVEIDIHVDNCSNGTGLQSGIMSTCSWAVCPGNIVPCADILACNPGTNPGGTMVLIANGLIIGQAYWLMIDGSNGATCQYTINYVTGVFEPQIDEEIQTGEAIPPVVCQGFDNFTMICGPPIPNAHGYIWNLGWNNTNITSTLPTNTINIPNNAPPGIWDICVLAFSGCDTSQIPFCFPVEIVEIPDIIKPTLTLCPEDFPISWHGINISGPGTYMKTFDNPDGCPYDSIWEVDLFPIVPVGELDVLYCLNQNFDPYFYENQTYSNSGTYTLHYPNLGLNGCDSTAHLNLTLVGIDAFIDLTCANGEFVLTPLIQELVPLNANIEWEWYLNGALIFDNKILYVLDGGCYECYATVMSPEGNCTFLVGGAAFCFNAADFQPPAPNLGFNFIIVCAQPGVFFTVIENPLGEPNLHYIWSGPSDAAIFQDGSNVVEMDFSLSAGGPVCVYAIGECGEGPSTCFNVEIQANPVAAFSYETDVCNDSTTIITFTGSAGPNAQVIWNFSNPSSISGSGFGPYVVSWNIDGSKIIDLQVIEPGCDTAIASGIINVSNLLTPVINCSSSISDITFDWTDVVGSAGYIVSINNGAPFPVATNSYTAGSLLPGTMVTLTLTVVSGGPCPDIIISKTCTAVDCPPPLITISGADSACLNNPMIITLSALVNGNPGVGVWAGPGIIDTVLGLFDPKVSGSGLHQITFTTDQSGCPFSAPYQITVFDSITADFTIDPLICITDLATVTYLGNGLGTANFAFDFVPATVISGAGSGPYELKYNTPGIKTVKLNVSDNGCISDLITQNTLVGPSLSIPAVNCQTNTSGVTFCWTNDPLVSNYLVNTLTAQSGVLAANCIDFGGLIPGDSVSIEIVSQTLGPCPARSDTFNCIAKACPADVITITPVADICLYSGTPVMNLVASVPGGNGTGTWSGPGISDPVNGKFDPFIAGAGSHVISYDYVDDGCDFLNSITINIDDPPQAVISNASFVLTCASGNILLLNGSTSTGSGISYKWSTIDGLIDSGMNSAIAQVSAAGHYQLKVINAMSGCVDSLSVTVTLDANTPTPDAGPDKVITCDTVSFIIGGNSSTGTNIVYTWSTPDGHIVGSLNSKQISVDGVGTYTLMVRDTSNGCQSSDQAIVTIDTSLAAITLTPGDTIDCNTPISDVQSAISAPVSDYDFNWTTINGVIVGATNSTVIDVSLGGTYTLTIKNKDNGCEKSASADVPASNQIISAVDVGIMNITCFGDNNGALTINGIMGGIGPYTYQWSVGPQSGNSISSLPPGQYSLTVTDQNGCSFSKVLNLTQPILVTVDLGPNRTVNIDDSVAIDLITNINPDTIAWTESNGLICPNCPKFQFIATSSSTISAMVTDTAGCSAFDSMRLTVIVPHIIYIPTVFSPNDDGINDNFIISGKKNLINIGYMRIFDRWGNLLYDKSNLTPGMQAQGWDGKFNGKPVQPGVYVYTAELQYEDVTETIKGDITLVR